jgi:quercetin dioxygenase-like cupin family protein
MNLRNSSFTAENKPLIKNLSVSKALRLNDLVAYKDGQVVSQTLAQNKFLNLTLFAFAKGEALSTHSSTGDAMVQVLEGCGQFTIDNVPHQVSAGETIVMPANAPHAVDALEAFKMLLTVVKPVS